MSVSGIARNFMRGGGVTLGKDRTLDKGALGKSSGEINLMGKSL